jgi:hypothetical protein
VGVTDPKYANSVLMSNADANNLVLAHELGHILLNDKTNVHSQVVTNLMWGYGGDKSFKNPEITNAKRLTPAQVSKALKSPLLLLPPKSE